MKLLAVAFLLEVGLLGLALTWGRQGDQRYAALRALEERASTRARGLHVRAM
jgi:hypothetical protein